MRNEGRNLQNLRNLRTWLRNLCKISKLSCKIIFGVVQFAIAIFKKIFVCAIFIFTLNAIVLLRNLHLYI